MYLITALRVRIIEGGKLIIPAPMRRELGIATGDSGTYVTQNFS